MVHTGNEKVTKEEFAEWELRIKERYELFGGLPWYLLKNWKIDELLAVYKFESKVLSRQFK